MPLVEQILIVVAAYLIGSVSFAIVTSRVLDFSDPRQVGSGNPGATNVVRAGGWLAAALTFLGDAGKAVATLSYADYAGASDGLVAVVGVATFLGHLYPIYHRFRGGKGVATYLGLLFGINPIVALAWVGGWLTLAGLSRHSSVAGITMCLGAPVLLWWQSIAEEIIVGTIFMSVLVIIRHRQNIKNLWAKTEEPLF